MTTHGSRRNFLRSGAAALPVLAFSPSAKAWLTCPDSAEDAIDIPGLDGVILSSAEDLAAAADDWGHIVSKTPLAVLLPASIEDVQAAVAFCNQQCIKVGPMSMVGNSHSTLGQSQAECGLVIDISGLSEIHEVSDTDVVVDAGVRWFELVEHTLTLGKSPLVLTDHIDLSIGGTLSVGGIGGQTPQHGLQTDNVLELWVVTADGQLKVCSATQNEALFNAVRGGLGQFGVIVKARIPLRDTAPLARHYTATYADVATLIADQIMLMNEGRFDYAEGFATPQADDSYVLSIELVKYYDEADPPDDAAMLAGLDYVAGSEVAETMPVYDFFNRLAPVVAYTQFTGEWYLPHPLADFFLPLSEAADLIEATLANTPVADIGYGPVLIYPFPRDKITAPFIPMPDEDTCVLFSLLRWAPSADPAVVADLLDKNRAVYEDVRDVGGKRYSISSIEFDLPDWIQHFAQRWPSFLQRKLQYDVKNTLTPGQGIFPW
ncbi:FAD-binding protein [Pseudenhygromyxa sp. WMMC2535]|uniref:FAD-binding protein n=1 Tax=Pseudenhygromyxa sp. WMMC2535 TaxID=2712867 RepID=UPI0015529A45|nr:FAD-binding protein [Pseudenhygromyxa sp. WMMC2535]NVB40912.1 FAD-binding protein [Pseudenhygromyxa sp. WMMC2535]